MVWYVLIWFFFVSYLPTHIRWVLNRILTSTVFPVDIIVYYVDNLFTSTVPYETNAQRKRNRIIIMCACDEISCFYAHWPGGDCTILFHLDLFSVCRTRHYDQAVCANRPQVNCGGIRRILWTELLSIMIIIRTASGCLPYRIGNLDRKPEPRRITTEPKANDNRKCLIEQRVVRRSRRTVVFLC